MTRFPSLDHREVADTTIKAVVLTAGTTTTIATVVVHHLHLMVTTQGEQVTPFLPQGQPLTPQQEANRLAPVRGLSLFVPTATGLVT